MDPKKELKRKLRACYDRLVKQWMAIDPAQLIEAADQIAASRFIRDSLAEAITEADAEFLLQYEDPLATMREKWVGENSAMMVYDDGLRHCVETLIYENHMDSEAIEKGGDMRLC